MKYVEESNLSNRTDRFLIHALTSAVLLAALAAGMPASARADEIPRGWEAENMKPIGYSDLNGHEAFKMAIKHIGTIRRN